MQSNRRPLRALISFVTGAYALGLLAFVVLRLLVGDSWWWLALLGNFTPFYFAALLVLFPLALLVRAKRGALLMLPMALLGLVWFGRLYLPKAEAAADTPSLRVVTFNVLGDNRDLSGVETWLRDQQADLMLMQETPPVWAVEQVPSVADIFPYQANQPIRMRYWGNNTWSRLPIVIAENFDLENDGTPSHSRVVVELGDQPVAVYNIHLDKPTRKTPQISLPINSPYLTALLKYDETARNGQIARLKELLADEPLPFIVAGDFNLSDQSSSYNDLAAFMGDSFREAGTGLGTSWPNMQALGLPRLLPPLMRIDYIWHSDDFRTLAAEQGPYLGSDHLPLSATLALK